MSENGTGPTYGIIVAAGRSERMDGIDKMYVSLMSRPLITWTVSVFQKCADIDAIVLVAAADGIERMRQLAREWRFTKVADVVAGGDSRQQSVRAGLDAARDAGVVVVHDGARPLITTALISNGVALARKTGAAVCAMPALDTVKEADGDPPTVRVTHDRSRIWLAQTPQVFNRALLAEAHARAEAEATDDSSLVEALGHAVTLYEGAPWNLKVTTRDDIFAAETLLRARFEAER